ncbi:MAG: dTDP-4-dehydrorhamnose 3,5-epimerase family protein [Candidatus Omnitrophica bacterium]|nr:dTDP-4-dehydrorhamnose 3,5-epimerase family protein [Candidatus Omnitrophota bacterium]
MELIPLKIDGAFRITLAPHRDDRGFLARTYDRDILAGYGLVTRWIQETHSFSKKRGTLRGLHFQCSPYTETKLVRVAQGRAFMVLVDMRAGSPTFGLWDSVELSIEAPELLYAPKGMAMGMYTLTDDCSLLYKMDTPYHRESSRTIHWKDPDLNISWPINGPLIISDKDLAAPSFKDYLAKEGAVTV